MTARICSLFLVAFMTTPAPAATASERAASGLIERIVPEHARQFIVETIRADNGRDVFEIESRDGKIVLRGNSPLSQAVALNRYLSAKRWEIFFRRSQQALDAGKPFDQSACHAEIYRFENDWCNSTEKFATEPTGDSVAIARRLYDKYRPRPIDNLALGKPVTWQWAARWGVVARRRVCSTRPVL